jgi:hypothetical protein
MAPATQLAHAGSVSGPYLIWMNLADDHAADEAIHVFTHIFDDGDPSHFDGTDLAGCWNSQAILLARELPSGITAALVRSVVIERSPAARQRLLRLLLKGDADIQGYDGVIVIVDKPRPAVVSISAKGRIKSSPAVGKSGHQADWPTAFCAVLPPISRKP